MAEGRKMFIPKVAVLLQVGTELLEGVGFLVVVLDHRILLYFLAQAFHSFLCAMPTFLSLTPQWQLALAERRKLCAYVPFSSQLLFGVSMYQLSFPEC